jgi:hypothetical protein
MYELLYSSVIVIETPNKSNQSNLEPTIFVTRTISTVNRLESINQYW